MNCLVKLVLTIFLVSLSGYASSRCAGGGEGGVPFFVIPQNGELDWKPITTRGSVEELISWDNTTIYRNSRRDVWEIRTSGYEVQRIWNFVTPLSRVTDPSARYFTNVALSSELLVYDRKASGYIPSLLPVFIPGPSRKMQQLFWNDRSLYLSETNVTQGQTFLSFWEANQTAGKAKNICIIQLPVEVGQLIPVQGSRYPHAIFYAEKQLEMQKQSLDLYAGDVKNCSLTLLSNSGPEFSGGVRQVHYFPNKNAYTILLNNPDRNLVWWDNTGCKFMNSAGNDLIVPNPSIARLVGWSSGEGISLFDPIAETQKKVGLGLKPVELAKQRTWLTSDGKKLIIAPRLAGEQCSSLMEIRIKN